MSSGADAMTASHDASHAAPQGARPISLEALKALSSLLDIPEGDALAALLDARAPEGYRRYEVPKGNGKVRVIHAPSDALKAAQRAVLDRALSRVPTSPFAHGFALGKSILTNARVHATTARAVLNVDLQDAFPSVSEARVRHILEWRLGPVLKLELPLLSGAARAELYEALTTLCTRDGALPQGAPTSGCLLNLVCASLDRKVFGLAMRSGLPQVRYSRYADDLTISAPSWSTIDPVRAIPAIRALLAADGFSLAEHKTCVYGAGSQQLVTGLVTNDHVSVPKRLRRWLRAVRHAMSLGKTPHQNGSPMTPAQVQGWSAYLASIAARRQRKTP